MSHPTLSMPPRGRSSRSILKTILIVLVIALLVGALVFTVWAYTPLGPMPETQAALTSDATVTVEVSPWLTFSPAGAQPSAGFVFYPGGRVDPASYAPAARALAEKGYLAVIVPMPFNLAVFGANRADDVLAAHPEIARWALGGHSLGGSMAAAYAGNHSDRVGGLVLWASYPAGSNDLSAKALAVDSIYGTLDGVAKPDEVLAAGPLLPAATRWIPIDGGNHAQFGWYGEQPGDNPAAISREGQQAQAVAATAQLLEMLGR